MICILILLLENSGLKYICKTGLTTHQHLIKDPNHAYAPQPKQMNLINDYSKLQLD
jgi:hypothetical protein